MRVVDYFKIKFILTLCSILLCCQMTSYAQQSNDAAQKNSAAIEPSQELSIEAQRKEAYKILEEILLIKEGPEGDQKVQEIKALYRKIIYNYPDFLFSGANRLCTKNKIKRSGI